MTKSEAANRTGIVIAIIAALAAIVVAVINTSSSTSGKVTAPLLPVAPTVVPTAVSIPPLLTQATHGSNSPIVAGTQGDVTIAIGASETSVDRVSKKSDGEAYTIDVHANEDWFDTGIPVSRGDRLEFIAEGSWFNGPRRMSPNGTVSDSCVKCVLPAGNAGELLGRYRNATDYGTSSMRHMGSRIRSDSSPFRIGARKNLIATDSGTLLLGMNDDIRDCRYEQCYQDNSGQLSVKVVVRRR